MTDSTDRKVKAEPKCYNFGSIGHLATRCPHNGLCGREMRERNNAKGHWEVQHTGRVEGCWVGDILLDTGCSRTLVKRHLVPDGKLLEGQSTTIRCAHEDTVTYLLAQVDLEIEGQAISVVAAVADTLPMSVLLGTDVRMLEELLRDEKSQSNPQRAMVMTRAQTRRQKEEENQQLQKMASSGVQPKQVEDMVPQPTRFIPDLDFADDLFIPSHTRKRLSRNQKRLQKLKYREKNCEEEAGNLDTKGPLDISAVEMIALQEEDPSLDEVRSAVDGNSCGTGFYKEEGLLYRQWTPVGSLEKTVKQLVLPTSCRKAVLELAHSIPLAGHLGQDKTAKRILQRFYWPTLFRDAKAYCRCCEQCQKCSRKKPPRAPLVPLPVMEEPFQRLAMDIVGPLPKSRKGNRFILVLSDYATRYPEAIPLKTVNAEVIAEEAVKFFAQVGIPQEILTDQGSNFTSQLLKEIYRLLHVQPIRTSPYHPQTDGVVKRFNQTLKSMLRKYAQEAGKDWDRLIPYLLFAYREVPQSSTGFSPFELLYGRPVRGPLDVLKETWEAQKRSNESVVSYVLHIQEKLEAMTDLVQTNMKEAQQQQKHWYDRHARSRELKEGDQVLILLPTASDKLFAQWQGPYMVEKRVGEVNYRVHLFDRKKSHRIFHINMLRKWNAPSDPACMAEELSANDLEQVPSWKHEGETHKCQLGEQLDCRQKEELTNILHKFKDVLQDCPGRTDIIRHDIHLKEGAHPSRQAPYRLPHAYRDQVQKEIEDMLRAGIIEPSSSEWSSPVVIVPKRDGTIRLCVDYCRLNSVSSQSAYPMPRVDDVIDQLGKAKFLTTLDLTRGYWQVPLSDRSKELSAFTTPFGLYQFQVMPFGLHGAPSTCQRMMDQLLEGTRQFATAYLDDVIIYSETWEEHLQHVSEILRRLQTAGLTAKPSKCHFGTTQCVYLGHVVGGGQVRPQEQKLCAVREFPVPTTKKEVRVFLGLTGYYRRFIPVYSTIATPITDLTKNKAPSEISWTEQCDHAFRTLKNLHVLHQS